MSKSSAFWLAAYAGTVFLANWALGRWGFVPVGFGLEAPAGVYFAGVAFTARDMLRETSNRWLPLFAILLGAALSYFIEDIQKIAIASAIAFGVSELLDSAVYEPLRQKRRMLALVASNTVGFVVDSALFLWIAFGSLAFIEGQLLGKAYMTIAAAVLLFAWKKARR